MARRLQLAPSLDLRAARNKAQPTAHCPLPSPQGKGHHKYRLKEEGLPGHPIQTYTHACTCANLH